MEIKIKGIYKHYKGNLYIVEDIATDVRTMERMVVYRGLYGDCSLWVRPYNDFICEVNGKNQKHRFRLQDIEDRRYR